MNQKRGAHSGPGDTRPVASRTCRSSISVIWASSQGVRRFNEFAQALRPVAPGTLTARLTELEEAGILARVLLDDRPPRVEYRLTKRGERVAAAVALLADLS